MTKENSLYFYTILFSFFIGIVIQTLFPLSHAFLASIVFLGCCSFFTQLIRFKKLSRKHFLIPFSIWTFSFGAIYFENYSESVSVGDFEHTIGEKVTLRGVVLDEPDIRDFNTRIIFKPQLQDGGKTKIILKTTPYPEYQYGDFVTVTGKLEKPKNFKTENGREFDYVNFLRKDNIFYIINWAQIKKTGSGGGSDIKRSLFKIKKKFLEQSKKLLPEPHSSLLGGLILGAKDSMGSKLQEDFRKTGIIHIVVLSGYNVTLVADAMIKFFAFLGLTLSGILGGFSIIFFAIMTGASATIIRASIMALLVILAKLTGRHSEITRSLFLAAFIMLLFNPMLIAYDPSFQLSFLASLGLIKLSPFIEKQVSFLPKQKVDLRGLFAATISTQVFVFPFLIWMTGEVSLVAFMVNLLILVVVPATMLIGFLMNTISFLWFAASVPISYVVFFLLQYSLSVVETFAKVPFASVQIKNFPFSFVILIYLGYTLIYLMVSKKFD